MTPDEAWKKFRREEEGNGCYCCGEMDRGVSCLSPSYGGYLAWKAENENRNHCCNRERYAYSDMGITRYANREEYINKLISIGYKRETAIKKLNPSNDFSSFKKLESSNDNKPQYQRLTLDDISKCHEYGIKTGKNGREINWIDLSTFFHIKYIWGSITKDKSLPPSQLINDIELTDRVIFQLQGDHDMTKYRRKGLEGEFYAIDPGYTFPWITKQEDIENLTNDLIFGETNFLDTCYQGPV